MSRDLVFVSKVREPMSEHELCFYPKIREPYYVTLNSNCFPKNRESMDE